MIPRTYPARPRGNTDAWYIVHRHKAKERATALQLQLGLEHPATRAAMARFAYYCGAGPVHRIGLDVVAWQREAGRRGYENRGWRKAQALSSHPGSPVCQYNHLDAVRKGES